MQRTIDGSATLEEQRRTLRFAELTKRSKLENYQIGDTEHLNVATFTQVDLGVEVPEFVMLPVPANKTPASVMASPFASGKNLVFHSTIYVEGKETEIVVLR